jgi:hypothetical protein
MACERIDKNLERGKTEAQSSTFNRFITFVALDLSDGVVFLRSFFREYEF